MKIEYEKSKKIIHFADLDVGTIFKYQFEDPIYMKTECIDNDSEEINSIDLSIGKFNYFSDYTEVSPLDATLYVKE